MDPADADPQVDHSARSVFDYAYDGAGNWPFNTAYAGTRGMDGFVTRLRSLTEAEQFIKAGIPLIASLSFKKGDLPGAGYGTNGHLMVIVGFDAGRQRGRQRPGLAPDREQRPGAHDVRPGRLRERLGPALRRPRLRHPPGATCRSHRSAPAANW